MPAVKKELPGREDLALALATFHPTLAALPLPPLPGYLAPLPAAAARCGKLNMPCRPETIMMAEAPLGRGDLKQNRGALFALEGSR